MTEYLLAYSDEALAGAAFAFTFLAGCAVTAAVVLIINRFRGC